MAWTTPSDWSYKEAPGSEKMNEQVRDNLNYLKASLPAGVMMDWGGATAPDQWLLCNGAAVSRSTYAALFANIGITFGVGNGTTTFNLPDSRGRATIGAGQGTSLTNRVLATNVGTETHTLTEAEMPSHTHTYAINSDSTGSTRAKNAGADEGTDQLNTGSKGDGGAHNNMQPSLVVTKIIKY
jgi:microcystin-dependent protein